MNQNQELLALLFDMLKAVRCCRQDTAFGGGVTFTQFYILDLISQEKTLKLSQLHTLLSVEKSTSTRLIEPLITQGLVIRERCASDFRSAALTVSPKGEEVREEIWACLNRSFDQLTREIPAEKKEEVYRYVTLFLKAVRSVFKARCCPEK